MQCFKCQHDNQKGSKFCSKCGKNFQSHKATQLEYNKSTDSNISNREHVNYPQQNALDALKKIEEEKSSNINKLWLGYFIIIISFGILSFLDSFSKYNSFFMFVGFALTILNIIITSHIKKLSDTQYYSIPMSKNSQGQHRCIFCGNKGIYKSTIYKTNTTVNACSKCQEVLYHN